MLDAIDVATKLVQIAFWIAAGTVAILTYLRARKTLLQPIRTEIFKIQLAEMKTILSLLVGKGEVDLRDEFGFDEALLANTVRMMDEYAQFKFGVEFDTDRPYSPSNCPIAIVPGDAFLVRVSDGALVPSIDVKRESDPDFATEWPERFQKMISVPNKFSEAEQKIEVLLDNPMLPSKLVELLEGYLNAARSNLRLIGDVVYKAAEEMPERFPDLDSLENSKSSWLRNRFISSITQMKPKATAIIDFVRHEYNVDNLLKDM